MKIYKLFFITLFSVIFFCSKAQVEPGQLVINAGYGYSPEFDGEMGFGGLDYPVKTNASGINGDTYPYPIAAFSSVSYNKGATIDIGLINHFSIGFAFSYQSEEVNWQFGSDDGSAPTPYQLYDKITRTNVALRFLRHGRMNKHFDFYYGIRFGSSMWDDTPSQVNASYNNGSPVTFLPTRNVSTGSLQVLCGLRYFPLPFLGIQVEAGIGSPYLAEAGLTFRINTIKVSSQTDTK